MSDEPHPISPCCFCGKPDYDYPDPTYLTLGTRSEVTRTWRCHVACFEERLPDLPEPWSVYDLEAERARNPEAGGYVEVRRATERPE